MLPGKHGADCVLDGVPSSPRLPPSSELRGRPTLVRALHRAQRSLGIVLRQLREQSGLSQESAAEQIGLSDRHLRNLELGQANVTLATLVACAAVYKVSLQELFAAP